MLTCSGRTLQCGYRLSSTAPSSSWRPGQNVIDDVTHNTQSLSPTNIHHFINLLRTNVSFLFPVVSNAERLQPADMLADQLIQQLFQMHPRSTIKTDQMINDVEHDTTTRQRLQRCVRAWCVCACVRAPTIIRLPAQIFSPSLCSCMSSTTRRTTGTRRRRRRRRLFPQ